MKKLIFFLIFIVLVASIFTLKGGEIEENTTSTSINTQKKLLDSKPIDLSNTLIDSGVTGLEIDNQKIDQEESTLSRLNNSKVDVRTLYKKIGEGKVKQDIYIENKDNKDSYYNWSMRVKVQSDSVLFKGKTYDFSPEERIFNTYTNDLGNLMTPHFFVPYINEKEEKDYKQIRWKDIGDKGGYAVTYQELNTNFIEFRLENIFIAAGDTYYIDPTFVNATNGFSLEGDVGISEPSLLGLAIDSRDNTYYGGVTGSDNVVHHFQATGNLSGGFGTSTGVARHLEFDTGNEEVLYISYQTATTLEVWNITNSSPNLISSFDTNTAGGNGSPRGVCYDSTDGTLWILNSADNSVYHFSTAGTNLTGSFSLDSTGISGDVGLACDMSEDTFYFGSNTPVVIGIADSSGNNLTGSVDVGEFGITDLRDMAYDTRNGSLWVVDNGNNFIYHIEDTQFTPPQPPSITSIDINSTSPTLNTSNVDLIGTFNISDPDGDDFTRNITWYKDGISQFTFYNTSGETYPAQEVLDSANTTEGDLWSYKIDVCDSTGRCNFSFSQNLTILSSLNIITIDLNSTNPETNDTSRDLKATFRMSSSVGNGITYNISWFNKSITDTTYTRIAHYSNLNYSSITTLTLESENTSKKVNITYQITATDGSETSAKNATQLTVLNDVPSVPSIIYPPNQSLTATHNMTLSCANSVDLDGDDIFYEFYVEREVNPPSDGGLILNSTSTQANATSLVPDGEYWWRCRANDADDTSAFNNTRNFVVNTILLERFTQEFNSPVSEKQLQNFFSNISYNSIIVDHVNATLIYNNTDKNTVNTSINTSSERFKSSFIIPAIENDTVVVPFTWNISIVLINGSTFYNDSYTGSQIVNDITLFSCPDGVSNTTQSVAINFTLADEVNLTVLNGSFDATFTSWIDDPDVNDNTTFSLEGINSAYLCLSPNDISVTLDAVSIYDSGTNYDARPYYYENKTFDNVTDDVGLYLLEVAKASAITFSVVDENENPKPDVLLKIERRYPGENLYRIVAVGRTGTDGKAQIYLAKDQAEAIYRFIVEENGQTVFVSEDTVITETAVTVPVVASTVNQIFNRFDNVDYDLTFNNDTKTFSLTYNDPTGAFQQGCLKVFKRKLQTETVVCDLCNQGSSGSLSCSTNNDTAVYIGSFYATQNPTKTIATKIIDETTSLSRSLGKEGLLYAVLVVMAMSLAGTFTPTTTIALGFLGLIISSVLGLSFLTYGTVIGLIIVGGLYIWKLRS